MTTVGPIPPDARMFTCLCGEIGYAPPGSPWPNGWGIQMVMVMAGQPVAAQGPVLCPRCVKTYR